MIFELIFLVILGCAVVMGPATLLALVVTFLGWLGIRTRALLLVPLAALQAVAWSTLLAGHVMTLAVVALASCTTLAVGGARLYKLAHPTPPPPAWYPAAPQRF
ncbi:hypothetical protein ACWCYY_25430 [Kitasatospora sp. NPDC001664]